jgi:uncharacterized protein (TIGR03437 family)
VLIEFDVLPAGTTAAPLVSTTGLIFTAVSGTVGSSPQAILLTDLNTSSASFSSTRSTDDGADWFTQTPTNGTVSASNPTQIQIQTKLAVLSPGIRTGTLRIAFDDGTVHSIGITAIISPAGTSPTSNVTVRADATSSCPSTLVIQMTTLEPNFHVSVGQKVPIGALIADDCGHLINSPTQSSVTMTPLMGNDLRLVPQGNGLWTGTWQPTVATSNTMIAVDAVAIAPGTTTPVARSISLSGSIAPDSSTSEAIPTGLFNAATYASGNQVALGSFVSIFGYQLGNPIAMAASGTPLPTLLGDTNVLLGDIPLHVSYVGGNQINALIPSTIAPNTQQQLVVQRGAITESLALLVTVAESQPGIYTINQQGTGQGVILIDGANVIAAPAGTAIGSRPAHQGEFIDIFATGLGRVSNPPADGAAAPSIEPLARTLTQAMVTVGGVPAMVSFSGLAPGFAGLYQVNVQIPPGAPAGDAIPVVLTVGAAVSNVATIAIQ